MKPNLLALLSLLFAFFQVGCASMSTMQTGEVLAVDKQQYTVGGGSYGSKSFSTSLNGKTTDADISAPYLELSYRRGVAEKIDVGAKLTLIGTAVVDGKYQLIDGDVFDMSVGAGLGYLSIESGTDANKSKSTIVDVILPIYLSAKLGSSFTPYISPKYILRNISGTTSGSTGAMGATAGVKIGSTWGLFAEYGFQKGVGNDFSANQVNVALFWE